MSRMKDLFTEMGGGSKAPIKVTVVVTKEDGTEAFRSENPESLVILAGNDVDKGLEVHQYTNGKRSDMILMLNDAMKNLTPIPSFLDSILKGLGGHVHDCDNCPAYDECDLEVKKPRC